MKEITPIEWLINELYKTNMLRENIDPNNALFELAKEIEEDNIRDFWGNSNNCDETLREYYQKKYHKYLH